MVGGEGWRFRVWSGGVGRFMGYGVKGRGWCYRNKSYQAVC
jgi:hypothetical protein